MAHIEKYKATSVGHMLAHYRRDASSLERDNIDPERVEMDYTLALDPNDDKVRAMSGIKPNWRTVEERIERANETAKAAGKRATRKDAVVMADVVVTLPENVRKGDEKKFFAYTYWYLIGKLGKENMMGGFVHRDEMRTRTVVDDDGKPVLDMDGHKIVEWTGERVRDHMHVPFTPILDGRFNYKKLCPRSFYQTMHKELGDYLERRLGYRPEIELSEEKKAEKVLSQVHTEDLDAAQAAIVEPAQREAERIVAAAQEKAAALLSEAETRKAELVTQIADKEGDLVELDNKLSDVQMQVDEETDRLECLRRANDICEGHVEKLESIAADVRGFGDASRAEKVRILDRVAAHCDELREAIYGRLDDLKRVVASAKSRIEFWHRTPSAFDRFIDDEVHDMQLGSRELGRSGDAQDWDDDAR